MAKHKINWLNKPGYKGETWNPIIGCSKISEGCENCYAEKMAKRLGSMKTTKYYNNVLEQVYANIECTKWKTRWNGKTHFVESALAKPLHWRKPRMIFVCSMGDLFHKSVNYGWITSVMEVIQGCPQHIFIILTKRPRLMKKYFDILSKVMHNGVCNINFIPLPNLWLGVTAENQRTADERIPILLQTPAAKRFVSIEPMLMPVNLQDIFYDNTVFINSLNGESGFPKPHHPGNKKLDWVIVGGESGPNARPMNPDWVRSVRNQCVDNNVPFFFKQWGSFKPMGEKPINERATRKLDGKEWNQWPEVK